MQSLYPSLASRFRVNKHFGQDWCRTNSIAQGCPLSVMWANLLGALWIIAIKAQCPDVDLTVFIGDKTIRAYCQKDFENALDITQKLDAICDQALNLEKVTALATNKEDMGFFTQFHRSGRGIKIAKSAITLGAQICVGPRSITRTPKKGLAKAIKPQQVAFPVREKYNLCGGR